MLLSSIRPGMMFQIEFTAHEFVIDFIIGMEDDPAYKQKVLRSTIFRYSSEAGSWHIVTWSGPVNDNIYESSNWHRIV